MSTTSSPIILTSLPREFLQDSLQPGWWPMLALVSHPFPQTWSASHLSLIWSQSKPLTVSLLSNWKKLVNKSLPWLIIKLQDKMRKPKRLYQWADRSKKPLHWEQYRHYHNILALELERAQNEFMKVNTEKQYNQSSMWHAIRESDIIAPKNALPLVAFPADLLNHHFATVSQAMLPLTPDCKSDITAMLLSLIKLTFDFSPLRQASIANLFHVNSKGMGCDNYAEAFFQALLPHLTDLFNCSLSMGVFLFSWKRAAIVPISKISNLSCYPIQIQSPNFSSSPGCWNAQYMTNFDASSPSTTCLTRTSEPTGNIIPHRPSSHSRRL